VKPTYIFEIGTNRGHSAAMFLELSRARVLSIDISTRKETLHAVITLKNRYNERFNFLGINSAYAYDTLSDEQFDLAFIDGAHDKSSVLFDLNTCKRLKIPYILCDDVYPRYGSVMEAIGEYENELELVLDMDNLRLYKTSWL
jgi:predicted O-methyltransferase YrrM